MPIATNGLVAYYNSKQGVSGSKWTNISPNTTGKYDGTIVGALLQDNGMYFDGNDYMTLPALTSNISDVWEIEVYAMRTILESGQNYSIYGGVDTSSFPYKIFALGIYTIDGRLMSTTNPTSGQTVSGQMFKVNYTYNTLTGKGEVYFNNSLVQTEDMTSSGYHYVNPSKLSTTVGGLMFGGSLGNPFIGHIASFKIYNRELTAQERTQNSQESTNVGLGSGGETTPTEPTGTAPKVSIVSISKSKISGQSGMNQSIITVKFDKDITRCVARLNGSSYDTGTIVHDVTASILANTEVQVIIDRSELASEGQNKINIYGQGTDGTWTPYEA